jgi:hypothetical protein
VEKWEYRHYDICSRGYINVKLSPQDYRELFQEPCLSVSLTEEEEHIKAGNIINYEKLMRILGKAGWELVCVVEEGSGKKEMFFKRRLEESPPNEENTSL